MNVLTAATATAVESDTVEHRVAVSSDGRDTTVAADRILLATGRRSRTSQLSLPTAGVRTTIPDTC